MVHQKHVVVEASSTLRTSEPFELGRSFVVPGLGRDSESPKFMIDIGHERENLRTDAPEIMIGQLFVAWRCRAEECPPGLYQVGAIEVEIAVDQKVLLFGSQRNCYRSIRLAKTQQSFDAFPGLVPSKNGVFLIEVSPLKAEDCESRSCAITMACKECGTVDPGV